MKKKIIGITIMAAIALGAGWNVTQNENEVDLTDLALSNVEALAQNEGSGQRSCFWGDDFGGSIFFYYVHCGTCIYKAGTQCYAGGTCSW